MDRADNQGDFCIGGFGLRTPLGHSVPAVAAAVQGSLTAFADHPFMISKAGLPMLVSMDEALPEEMPGADRIIELGLSAAMEALAALTESGNKITAPVDVLIGLPAERPGLPKGLIALVSKALKSRLSDIVPVASVESFQRGHTSGLIALLRAARKLREGSASICLVGSIDSYLEPETLEWIDSRELLHSEQNPYGFIPGEAAGFCLLSSRSGLSRFGLQPIGTLVAVAAAKEKKINGADTVCLGEGLTSAMRQILRRYGAANGQVARAIGDLNGQPERADDYAYSIVRVADYFVDPSNVLTPAEYWGDIGAASGLAFMVLSCSVWEPAVPGFADLLFTSSEHGERAAALIKH